MSPSLTHDFAWSPPLHMPAMNSISAASLQARATAGSQGPRPELMPVAGCAGLVSRRRPLCGRVGTLAAPQGAAPCPFALRSPAGRLLARSPACLKLCAFRFYSHLATDNLAAASWSHPGGPRLLCLPRPIPFPKPRMGFRLLGFHWPPGPSLPRDSRSWVLLLHPRPSEDKMRSNWILSLIFISRTIQKQCCP